MNFNQLLQSNNFVFLSPHFDDAVLSCGSLILELIKAHKSVQIITLFTQCSLGPETRFAKKFVHESGYQDSSKLFSDRIEENKLALHTLGVKDIVNLKYIDAAWREYPSSKHVFSGKINSDDIEMINKIITNLRPFIHSDSVLLAPIAVGNHVDHVITHMIAEALPAKEHIYWTDHPYVMYQTPPQNPSFSLKANQQKILALAKYTSQMKAISQYYDPLSEPEKFYVAS